MPEDEQGFHHLLQEQRQGYQFQIDPPGKQIIQSVTDAYTDDFTKKVFSVYTHSMTTIYLSLSVQVAKNTFFMKFLVCP